MRKIIVAALYVLTGAAWGQKSGERTQQQVLFSVNGRPVYTDEFTYLYKKNHLKSTDFTEAKVEEYLDLLVNFKLKVEEARARGLDTTESFVKEFKTYREELKKPYVAEKDELDRLTQEAYQRLTEEVKAAHILISLKPDATPEDTLTAFKKIMTVRDRLTKGEDFEHVAKEVSEDPSARVNGGNLGYFTVLQMVYPFEEAAYKLKPGEISNPVRTRFGYHLVKVLDRKPARGEVEVSHIILRTGSGDDAKVKNKIFEIYDQLQGGRSWDELCKEFSDDPSTKDSGGKLRPFGVGAMASVPEFESVAFSLKNPGDVSDPFQTGFGWHIVRLEKKIPVPAFAEVSASLKRRVGRDERLQLSTKKMLEQKKKTYGFTEKFEIKKQILASADSSLQKGTWKFTGDAALRNAAVCELQAVVHTAGEFIRYAEKNQSQTSQAPVVQLGQLYDRWVEEKLNELEDAKLVATVPEFRNLLNEYREGILLFTIMEKEVWNKASEDSIALRKHYEATRDAYQAGDRVRARIFASADAKFMEEIKLKVSKGDSLKQEDVKKFKSITPFANYERADSKVIASVPWTIGSHSTEVDGTYYLVEVESLLPPGRKNFEEVRAQVVSNYQDALEKQWLVALKQKYPVKVNSKGKKTVIRELVKK